MPVLQILAVVVAPAIGWAAYHYYHDRHQPEPYRLLFVTFCLGIVAGALGVQVYAALDLLNLRWDAFSLARENRWAFAAYAILVIGFVEETVKFLPFWLVALRFDHFDDPMDGIVYASFIGLGFAAYENVHYLTLLAPLEAFLRGIASPLVHVVFASIWGHMCAVAVLNGRPLLPSALGGLALAALMHGLYDFLVIGFSPWVRPVGALIILCVWVWRRRLISSLVPGHRETDSEKSSNVTNPCNPNTKC